MRVINIIVIIFILYFQQEASGQALCYDMEKEIACGDSNYPGQAGDYPDLFPALVKDESNGLIFDTKKRLWWSPCSMNNCSEPKKMDWYSAKKHCISFVLSEKKWRLPTVIELNSLVLLNKIGIKSDLKLFPDTQLFNYWSVTPSVTYKQSDKIRAWFVSFSNAFVFDAVISEQYMVRCVADDTIPIP